MHRRRQKVSGPLGPASVQFDEAHAGQDEGSSTSLSECALVNVVFVEDMFHTYVCQEGSVFPKPLKPLPQTRGEKFGLGRHVPG